LSVSTTIKDIARMTGFSTSTVSLVLNHVECRIAVATREKILQKAKEMNYRSNRMAAGLVTKRSRMIGLIVPDITNGFFAEIAAEVETECMAADYSVILCNTNDIPTQDIKYINLLLECNVEGILFVMSAGMHKKCAEECLCLLSDAKIPTVIIDREWQNETVVNVISDNERGGYLACRHLLDLGHSRIGYISGPMGNLFAKKRLQGYIQALQQQSFPFAPELVLEGDYHMESGYLLSEHLLKLDVSAIITGNDMMALGVYKRIREKGLKIPQDISIVGYDNLAFTEFLEIPLTTVAQPAREMGRVTMQKLLRMLNNQPQQSLVFVPQLVVRGSTAPLLKQNNNQKDKE
jgi:LacI family transcriptional regulator